MNLTNENVRPDTEHEMHCWAPFPLKLTEHYDYLSDGLFYRVLYVVLKTLALLVFQIVNPIWLGFTIRGRENIRAVKGSGAISICNHVHALDCTLVGSAYWNRKQYFVTLQSNLEIPLVRHLVKALGGIPVPRNLRMLPYLSENIGKALKRGQIVQIYPEGVLKFYSKEIRGFYNGAFVYAYDHQVPVVPSVITFSCPKGLRRLIRHRPCMQMTVLPPVYPDCTAPRREEILRLKETCRRMMKECFARSQQTEESNESL